MKRISLLLLAAFVTVSCSQSDEATTAAPSTEPDAPAVVDTAPAAAETPAETTADAAAAAAPASADAAAPVQVDLSAVEAAGFVEGRHYRRLSPTQTTSTTAGSVEVAEFFMYSCIHCFNLEPYVQAWLPGKPDYIDFVHIPTTWNAGVRMHAQAFYAAQALGKGEEMHQPFFREMHDNGNFLESPAAMADFFARFDVSNEDFESAFDSFAVHTRVNRAEELGNRYRVDSTPTIIVNGKYRTDVGMAGGYDQLFELIEALAAAEIGQ